ncbi:MAG: furin-like repeat-containing protein, partial [Cyclonatronaceae bacterium]
MRNMNAVCIKRIRIYAFSVLILLLMMAGCDNVTSPDTSTNVHKTEQSFETADALYTISEGVQGGTVGFYFLPPMVKSPDYRGVFDGSLSPVVEICKTTACSDIHARYSMTEGTGSEVVRLEEEDEHYIVNWHTGETGAVAGQTYRIRVSVAGTVLGYENVTVVSTGREAIADRSDGSIALVANQTLPIKFRIEEGTLFVVGSDGGTFNSNDGAVTIEVPEGAVVGEIGIIVTPIIVDFNNPNVIPGTAFNFRPSPYSFNHPVILTIVYDPANLPDGSTESLLRILKLVDGEWVAVVGGSVDATNNRVSAPIDGFSSYGVGSEPDPCEGVTCPNDKICYQGTCFTGCPDGEVLDEENNRCITAACV